MEVKDEKPLIIPENCPPMEYVINGFTRQDISYTALLALIGAILGIALGFKYDNPLIGIIVCFLIVGTTVSILRRNAHTENLIDSLKILMQYQKAQKKYEYKHVNEWELSERTIQNEDRGKK